MSALVDLRKTLAKLDIPLVMLVAEPHALPSHVTSTGSNGGAVDSVGGAVDSLNETRPSTETATATAIATATATTTPNFPAARQTLSRDFVSSGSGVGYARAVASWCSAVPGGVHMCIADDTHAPVFR